jgi:hypothetical protein
VKKIWTRRKFLETSVGGSILVGSAAVAGVGSPLVRLVPQEKELSSSEFDSHQRKLLRAAMDEIIPASDGMPAASEVGGVEYLDRLARQIPKLKREFQKGLAALEEASRKRFQKNFLRLSRAERVEALAELEKRTAPKCFSTLRDSVYEAYYIQPQVWKLIDYEFYPTDQPGPRMKPFDEAVLAQVRKLPKLYREVE